MVSALDGFQDQFLLTVFCCSVLVPTPVILFLDIRLSWKLFCVSYGLWELCLGSLRPWMKIPTSRVYLSLPFQLFCVLCHAIHVSPFLPGGFPDSSDGKESACNAGDPGSIPGLGRSFGEGTCNPLQSSRLGNPIDRGDWWAIVHRVARQLDSTWQLNNNNIVKHTVNICLLYARDSA